MRIFVALVGFLLVGTPVTAQDANTYNWERARNNYVALLEGRTQFHRLTPFEQRELQEFRRRLAEDVPDDRTPRERCEDEQIERLRSKQITYLDRRHIDMVCRGERD